MEQPLQPVMPLRPSLAFVPFRPCDAGPRGRMYHPHAELAMRRESCPGRQLRSPCKLTSYFFASFQTWDPSSLST